jgi:hypothetical protein
MTSQSMTARTTSMTFGAKRRNPITEAVAAARRVQADLTPRQSAVREAGRAQVAALVASGQFSLAPRR